MKTPGSAVSLVDHETEINIAEQLNQEDYFLQFRTYKPKHRLPVHHNSNLEISFLQCTTAHLSSKRKISLFIGVLASHCSQAELSAQREMRGPLPSSPSLLYKPTPSCQICLKFGCVRHRVQGQQRKWLLPRSTI